MSKLNIYCLDDIAEKDCIVSLTQGDHIIGRGNLLQIKDKRVSRKHALIQVTEQHITLTSIHENPCFFRAHNGQSLTILRQNKTNPLDDGDQFALLPDDLWFRVRVQKETLTNETLLNAKRPSEDESLDITSKKQKLTESEPKETEPQNEPWGFQISAYFGADTVPTSSNSETEPVKEGEAVSDVIINNDREPAKEAAPQVPPDEASNEAGNEAQQVKEGEAALEVKQEPEDVAEKAIKIKQEPTSSSQEEPVAIEAKVEPAPADVLNEAGSTDSSVKNGAQAGNGGQQPKKAYRERCWYGQRCFRRNPNHREQFSHPGDQDYQSDPEDDRPLCPYGATCYRINPEHRRDYKHMGKPAPKPPAGQPHTPPGSPPANNTPGQSPAKKKKRAPKKKPKKDQSFGSEDEYDYDDPFLNDDSEDDYEPTDLEGSSDDEFKDSQDSKGLTEEESQERKRMLREAKKFLRSDEKKKNDDDDDAEDD